MALSQIQKCGILLSMVLIFISGMLTRLACYLLLKSAIMARRRNFEFLAFHTFGSTGKLAVEMSVIGFLIGVCIAFFVVIGDLGPPLAAEFLTIENSPNLRTNVLMLVGLCVALPLGMLRKIDSLTSLSALSIAFYLCLILKIFAEAVPNLALNEWWHEVNWWQSDGILPCLPIFSMALSCQTQLFEFFDTLNDPSLKRMQSVVSGAVHLCSIVYIMVGTFGYIAFHDKAIMGNILVLLTPSVVTEFIKLGFILTVAVSFPLCLFPCRSSLHSLLFKQGFGHHDINVTVIPDHRFRILTISLVIVTIGIAIMLPNIEFVLGIIGSTIGTLICLIFPAIMFIHDTSKNTTEKRMAQVSYLQN
ncbi:putative sodium-coupled neutral amino acid transporter 10 isoform X2 [Stegodyphus dumicola]|uniref:putative sodium-coupled neutral amino acid transporter 10 isoform X2 n=1 Tax=Stegodyphus dumicola TaxID=202533 RepID=UPI0015ADE288|nr:putative sodium-coupled neutral amino acid transporter 10 isoform X2 [Stegodyphus dumicola]